MHLFVSVIRQLLLELIPVPMMLRQIVTNTGRNGFVESFLLAILLQVECPRRCIFRSQ